MLDNVWRISSQQSLRIYIFDINCKRAESDGFIGAALSLIASLLAKGQEFIRSVANNRKRSVADNVYGGGNLYAVDNNV